MPYKFTLFFSIITFGLGPKCFYISEIGGAFPSNLTENGISGTSFQSQMVFQFFFSVKWLFVNRGETLKFDALSFYLVFDLVFV